MDDLGKQMGQAFRSFTSAQINLSLVQARYNVGESLSEEQAMGTVEGTVDFLVRMIGRDKAAEFFYRIGDGVVAPKPQTVEK